MPEKANLLSLNVSKIKEVLWNGQIVRTGIFKTPTLKKLKVEGVNIEGDDQADRNVHGGMNKAIYAYPYENYDYFKEKYPNLEFTSGMFGENLTTMGILENELFVGDKLEIGTTELVVIQPRVPCYKLGIKFGAKQIIQDFNEAKKPGFYCRIIKEGELETGDEIIWKKNPDPKITIIDLLNILRNKAPIDVLNSALQEEFVPERIRERVRLYLGK